MKPKLAPSVLTVLMAWIAAGWADPAQISGCVRDNSGNPVPHVHVTGDDFVGDLFPATTDTNGFYVVEVPAEGNYRVTPNCGQLEDLDFSCPAAGAVTITSGPSELNFTVFPVTRPLQITNILLADAEVGTYYRAQLWAKGGHKPYQWQLAADSTNLPAGLALNPRGLISGLPVAGSVTTINVEVKDADSTTTNRVLTLAILPDSLPGPSSASATAARPN